MAEASITIASAVILPEAAEPTSPPSGPTKRRQSSISSNSSKRPRLSSTTDEIQRDHESTPPTATERPPDRRKSGQLEERKRGQRLFGALLGTLSQGSSSNAQKRRADIEKKQQAKLKLQAEEYDKKKRTELDKLLVIRRREQKKFDAQSMRIRHSNLLAMAQFLSTKAEPKLYYKPWELFPGDGERIKSQLADTEALIDKEVEEYEEEKNKNRSNDNITEQNTNGAVVVHEERNGEDSMEKMDTVGSENNPAEELSSSTIPQEDNIVAVAVDTNNDEPSLSTLTSVPPPNHEEVQKENGDDGGEVVLEGEEDTVIY
ncbi:MAG: hypothetical protein M1827_006854 [Pycnora praestabilis]|nr:MAG: hypothetical protein M1827_006854 [Pycnora praestabilis]